MREILTGCANGGSMMGFSVSIKEISSEDRAVLRPLVAAYEYKPYYYYRRLSNEELTTYVLADLEDMGPGTAWAAHSGGSIGGWQSFGCCLGIERSSMWKWLPYRTSWLQGIMRGERWCMIICWPGS